MLKKLFILLFLLLIIVYLSVAVTALNTKPDDQVCQGMELIIKDSIDYGFITSKDIQRLLEKKELSPVGKTMGEINTRQMEDELGQFSLIKNVECYRMPNFKIEIEVTQRVPILRIMANNGDNYFIDREGQIMPLSNSSAHVAVVTGYVSREFASQELYKFGVFLQEHPLWLAQVEQINITKEKQIELIPRVGEHIIFVGKPEGYEEKFERLETFYKKGLNEIGWNKYSRISVEFNNQIICTKKK